MDGGLLPKEKSKTQENPGEIKKPKEITAVQKIYQARAAAKDMTLKKITQQIFFMVKNLEDSYQGAFTSAQWDKLLKKLVSTAKKEEESRPAIQQRVSNVYAILNYVHYVALNRLELRRQNYLNMPFSLWAMASLRYLEHGTPETEQRFHETTNSLIKDHLGASMDAPSVGGQQATPLGK